MLRVSAVRRETVRTVLILLVLSCLLPGIFGAVTLFVFEYQQGMRQLESDVVQTGRALVQAVDNEILRVQSLAQGLATSDSLLDGNLVMFHRQTRRALKETGLGATAVLTGEYGQQILNSSVDFGQRLPMHGNPDMVRRVFDTGEPDVSDIFISRVLGQPVIAVGVPVLRDGKTIYLLTINVLPDRFNDILKIQGLPPGWIAAIFDSKGTIVAHSRDPARLVGQKPSDDYFNKLMSSREGSYDTVTRDGMAVRAAHSSSPVTHWRVAIAIPQDLLAAQLNRNISTLALGIAALFAIGLGLAWVISGKIARSFHALIPPAKALGAGETLRLPALEIEEAAAVAEAMRNASSLLEARDTALKEALRTLSESEERYRALFSNMSEALAIGEPVLDAHGRPTDLRLLQVNEAFYRHTGIPKGIEGRCMREYLPRLEQSWIDRHAAVAMTGKPDSFEHAIADTGRHFQIYAFSPFPGRFASLFVDVSDQKRLLTELEKSQYRSALALKAGGTAVWEMDVATQKLLPADDLLFTMLGYAPGRMTTAAEWLTLMHEEDRAAFRTMIDAVIAGGQESYLHELRLRASDGSWRWILSHAIAAERDAAGKATRLIGTHTDITERKQAQERARQAALHDPLTGLPNRALVFEYGGYLIAGARRNHGRGALLFIDLDRFKPINDLYGHDAGDRVLQEVARRLTGCTRDEDLVGRLGGDEFVVILPNLEAGRHRAAAVAQHLVASISMPYRIGSLEVSLSPSIGISFYPEHAADIGALIHAADLAMYQVKQSGRADYRFYTREMERRAGEANSLEARVRQALRHGGLQLHYQPVVDIYSGRVRGVEALLRMSGGDGCAISPERFIPVAESAGLIAELGEWVVTEACRQHEAWRREGMPVSIAVNVSPLQFRQRDFADRLHGIIVATGVAPAGLEVEVTESAIMDNLDEAIHILDRIKSFGVKVALDDFGTGYSSLSRLTSLPLDKLKVDQSFVQRVESDQACRTVTSAIIALGRNLRLDVIGEGIESENALRYLREHGCTLAQGYWFSRPLPAAEFARWYRETQEG